jgi:hypothetical protein
MLTLIDVNKFVELINMRQYLPRVQPSLLTPRASFPYRQYNSEPPRFLEPPARVSMAQIARSIRLRSFALLSANNSFAKSEARSAMNLLFSMKRAWGATLVRVRLSPC